MLTMRLFERLKLQTVPSDDTSNFGLITAGPMLSVVNYSPKGFPSFYSYMAYLSLHNEPTSVFFSYTQNVILRQPQPWTYSAFM